MSDTISKTIGMIGLGLMGTAMTERLLAHGWQVRVWNRSRGKAAPLIAQGAVWSDDPIADCTRVIVSLYDSEAVREVMDSMQCHLRLGHIIIDTTTGEPEQSAALATRLAALGVAYLDAPISGSSEQTRCGEATVMVGGDPAAFAACADLWPILGGTVHRCGGSGSAARMKLITNLVLGLNRAVLAEGLAFAEAIGVEPAAALAVLQAGNAYSRAMDVKGRKMIARDYTPQARLSQHLKDLHLMLHSAAQHGMELPLVQTHRLLLEKAERLGLGDLDNCAVLEVLRPARG